MSTDLETTPSTEITEAQTAALAAAGIADIETADLKLPDIKITQQMSREVTTEGVPAGVWLNTVTGEEYGEEIEFVVVRYVKGRFYVHNRDTNDEQVYVASGPVAPEHWPEEFAGKPFADIPLSEEQWKARSNAGEIEWGSGPPIVTTHNFIGFVKDEGVPARLRLNRTSAPAAQKIMSVLKWSNRDPWAASFKIKLVPNDKGGKVYYVAKARAGEQSDAHQVEVAKQLAAQLPGATAETLVGEEGDSEAKPAAAPSTPAGGVKL